MYHASSLFPPITMSQDIVVQVDRPQRMGFVAVRSFLQLIVNGASSIAPLPDIA
jgi:hypothetical protein